MDDFDRRILDEFKELERQMGRMLRSSSLSRTVTISSCEGGGWKPDVDVYETTNQIIVLMDTAGIDIDNMTVTAEKNSILSRVEEACPSAAMSAASISWKLKWGFSKELLAFLFRSR